MQIYNNCRIFETRNFRHPFLPVGYLSKIRKVYGKVYRKNVTPEPGAAWYLIYMPKRIDTQSNERLYKVTRRFTQGPLKGIAYTDIRAVPLTLGRTYKGIQGTSNFRIIAVTEVWL